MQNRQDKKILAVVSDLMFTVKINEAAKRAGLPIEFVKSEQDVLDKAKEKPRLVILDLNFDDVNPLAIIQKIKADPELKGVRLISFLSHVQGELKMAAQEAGCDMVLARSAFSQNIVQILQRHAGVV